MSSEQRWMINDALGLLLQISRSCCLAPVRFVKISTDTFIYISRPLLLLNVIIASIMQLRVIYFLYSLICSTERENFKNIFFTIFNVTVIAVFVSYAVLHGETRIKNYMTCLTKLKRALKGLQSTEEYNIKKWHVLIMFISLTSGITFSVIFTSFISTESIDSFIITLILEITTIMVIQQQFLYFSLYVNFVLKIIKHQLQEELTKIISDKDGRDNSTSARLNIPLKSINKAIDMIGMTDILFPVEDVLTTRNLKMAQKILQINESYVLTCEVLRDLGNSDSFLLFLQLIYLSFSLMFSTYHIIVLFHEDGSFWVIELVVPCLQICILSIEIIMLVEPCHGAHETILKIRFLVCEILSHVTSKNDPIFGVMEGFFHQLVLNDTSYTALGICKIGRPLITSIMGVVITVLIAFFQF